MNDSRLLIQRVIGMSLLTISLGYAATAGYWFSEDIFRLGVINLFWFVIFLAGALIVDGSVELRQRIRSLGWLRLFGVFFAFISGCDLVVAIYWYTQKSMWLVQLNVLGVVVFGLCALGCFYGAELLWYSEKNESE